jgi:uncharacterized membrane protein
VLTKSCLPFFVVTHLMSVCDACEQGKSHHLSYLISTSTFKAPLVLIFSDVWVLLMILLEDTNTMLVSLMTSVNLHGFTSLKHKFKVFQKL